jgi:predicted metal-binding protein
MRDDVPAEWRKAVLVCAKCSKKVKGGFGKNGRTPLARALRALSNGKKGRKADFGVIETRCLKLCPKGRVVIIDGAAPERWMLVKPGTPIGEVADRLGLSRPPE